MSANDVELMVLLAVTLGPCVWMAIAAEMCRRGR